ncbi:MAG: restriction endonuclease subunit S [Methylobacter sp.]|uniref:restriction endonuclease subunit S n=1 Tax=Methylobacter sp. TaxID=2051955 RepID=UPI0027319451|nr:restriction endonuclease subunit S [Methylobacter sp.]MDP1664027.1 restriction endonuclease subunit S [Methylobacter sp.]
MNKLKLLDLLESWDAGAWGESAIDQATAVSVLRSTNFLNSGELALKNQALLDIPDVIYEKKKLFLNDILLERSGGGEKQPVGRVAIFKEEGRFICGNFISCLRVKKSVVEPEYLLLRLLNVHWSGQTEKFQTATTGIRNLQMKEYLNQELVIPDIEEQCQITTKLKAQLAEVETARKALELQQQEIVNLANAYIRESIEQSPVTETRLGEVLAEVKKGIGETWADYPVLGATRGGLAAAKTVGAGRARDLSHVEAQSRARPAPTTTREPPGKQPQRYKPVFCGTVFYNPMRILIGSIAFVDDDDEPGITSPDYVALQGKAGLVDSRWFYYWLRSPYGEQCINSLARGAVRERMLFNRLAEGSILLPPYQEQLRVSKALATLKSVKSAMQEQLNELNKIPERLLAKAFEQK